LVGGQRLMSWRWLFGPNLPLGLLGLGFSLRVLSRTRPDAGDARLDVTGFLLLSPGRAEVPNMSGSELVLDGGMLKQV
jgi:hypothetical protein